MSGKRRDSWSGRVQITEVRHRDGKASELGPEIDRSIVVRELPRGSGETHHVQIQGLGSGDITVNEDGSFQNQPFATHGASGVPETRKISGKTEGIGTELHGGFKVHHRGKEVARGRFSLKRRSAPSRDDD